MLCLLNEECRWLGSRLTVIRRWLIAFVDLWSESRGWLALALSELGVDCINAISWCRMSLNLLLLTRFWTCWQCSSVTYSAKEPYWSDSWCVIGQAKVSIVNEANIVSIRLPGLKTLLVEHCMRLDELDRTYCDMCKMQGPLRDDNMQQVNYPSTRSRGGFVDLHQDVVFFLDGLGRWAFGALETMGNFFSWCTCAQLADVFVRLVEGTSVIIVERDSKNGAGEELAPVSTHQLVDSNNCSLIAALQ